MCSEAAYIGNLRKLSKTEPTPDHIQAIEQEAYQSKNDRALALLLGSQLEANLLAYISKMRIRTDMNAEQRKTVYGYEGILGSFSAKISTAFALNLFGRKTYDDLNLIRSIRNAFAHSRIAINFQMKELIEICKHLKTPELPSSKIPFRYIANLPNEEQDVANDLRYAKTRFVTSCHQISFRMLCITNPKIFEDRFDTGENILP